MVSKGTALVQHIASSCRSEILPSSSIASLGMAGVYRIAGVCNRVTCSLVTVAQIGDDVGRLRRRAVWMKTAGNGRRWSPSHARRCGAREGDSTLIVSVSCQ